MMRSGILSVLISGAMLPALGQTPVRRQFAPVTTAKMNSIPVYTLPDAYKDRTAHPLPRAVDNSKQKFMPPWGWSIQGWSCANATATSYVYDYEVQFNRNIATSGSTPLYTYEYTYHFLNSNNQAEGGDGWMFIEAFDILKETGGASSADFGGFEAGNGNGAWMTGYDKYYNAMKNRVNEYYRIDASVATADEAIKQYLFDHADGSAAGGLMTFQINSESMPSSTIGGRRTFTNLGGGGGHALSIVGYDDDFQGGSYLTLNNWGDGLYWCPYKLLRAGGSLADKTYGTPVMFCRLKKDYSPKFAFKISITHDQRDKVALMTGVAPNAAATAPSKTKDYAGAFNFGGGAVPMMGKGQSGTIEIGLDLTDFASLITGKEARFFFNVVSKGGTGKINSVTLMDYTGGAVKEIPAADAGKAIASGATTSVSVAWSGTVGLADGEGGTGSRAKAGAASRLSAVRKMDILGRALGNQRTERSLPNPVFAK
ncbi:MAG: hypothetical protein JWP91_3617 [Fibrobacteres bacterium]|nr:hypothetical protein [Fibrobacterota bacterium]